MRSLPGLLPQELDDDLWRRIVDVNLTGTMLCSKCVSRQMIAQDEGGSIISISSGAAIKAPATYAAYSASKAGVHALSATLAAELWPLGITSNVIAPGLLDTARIDVLRTEGRWERRLKSIPIGRPGTPQEVAELVRYLSGPHARWISGEVIMMNGRRSAARSELSGSPSNLESGSRRFAWRRASTRHTVPRLCRAHPPF